MATNCGLNDSKSLKKKMMDTTDNSRQISLIARCHDSSGVHPFLFRTLGVRNWFGQRFQKNFLLLKELSLSKHKKNQPKTFSGNKIHFPKPKNGFFTLF